MLSSEIVGEGEGFCDCPSEYEWLSGALAGLQVKRRREDWVWRSFLRRIVDMIEDAGVGSPVFPSPDCKDMSALEVLGGFVSVAGAIVHDGLEIVSPESGDLRGLLDAVGVSFRSREDVVIVSPDSLVTLVNLSSIRGPLAEEIANKAGDVDD
ncbi:MAG: hypothetical protein HXY34_00485 [Candidatus Thorarchaeota archaeon]|nr:hypothetical protein [Candidatus Thorarchaeota archaeon]